MPQYTVTIVDDHKLFREGLKLLLENLDYIAQVTEAADAPAFMEHIATHQPDITFMDIEMPGTNGIECTAEALRCCPGLNIIALSMYGDENYYSGMINAGAKGFMLKNSGIDDVEDAIRTVLKGNNYFSPEILNRLIKSFGKKPLQDKDKTLTDREEEVLYHICKGYSNQEIADKLYLSKRTIDKHRENLLSKTNSRNTVALVMYAVKNGIVEV